jgi:hypothetical protein
LVPFLVVTLGHLSDYTSVKVSFISVEITAAGSFSALSSYLSVSVDMKTLKGLSAFLLLPSVSWALVSSSLWWSFPFQFKDHFP